MAEILQYQTKQERQARARQKRASRKAWREWWELVAAIVVAEIIVTGLIWAIGNQLGI